MKEKEGARTRRNSTSKNDAASKKPADPAASASSSVIVMPSSYGDDATVVFGAELTSSSSTPSSSSRKKGSTTGRRASRGSISDEGAGSDATTLTTGTGTGAKTALDKGSSRGSIGGGGFRMEGGRISMTPVPKSEGEVSAMAARVRRPSYAAFIEPVAEVEVETPSGAGETEATARETGVGNNDGGGKEAGQPKEEGSVGAGAKEGLGIGRRRKGAPAIGGEGSEGSGIAEDGDEEGDGDVDGAKAEMRDARHQALRREVEDANRRLALLEARLAAVLDREAVARVAHEKDVQTKDERIRQLENCPRCAVMKTERDEHVAGYDKAAKDVKRMQLEQAKVYATAMSYKEKLRNLEKLLEVCEFREMQDMKRQRSISGFGVLPGIALGESLAMRRPDQSAEI